MPDATVVDSDANASALESIPAPEVIRRQIGENCQANRLLRSLLKLSRRLHINQPTTLEGGEGDGRTKSVQHLDERAAAQHEDQPA